MVAVDHTQLRTIETQPQPKAPKNTQMDFTVKFLRTLAKSRGMRSRLSPSFSKTAH